MILLLVIASVIAFWMSTQQSTLLIRAPIWLAGAGFLAIAGYLALQAGGHDAVFAALRDVWTNRDDPTEGVLFEALTRNAPTVQRYVTPLIDLLILFAAVLGVLAFLALTPGQFLERAFVRPLAIGVLGAAAGAALALGVVAVAIWGPAELKRYVGYGDRDNPRQVYDGDTFFVGDVPVRLLNVDAPELRQICRRGETTIFRCGEEAKRQLETFIGDAIIECDPAQNATGRTRESYSRPLVNCSVRRPSGDRADLAELMIKAGMAVPYDYGAAAAPSGEAIEWMGIAQRNKRGLWAYCTLHPRVWRDDPAARNRFVSQGELPADPAQTIGDCPRPAPPPA
jgi:endonuclease YncB( thermonuclease family)